MIEFLEFVAFLFDILEVGNYWRFALCLLGGISIAALERSGIATEWLRNVMIGATVLASIVLGWRWESSASTS